MTSAPVRRRQQPAGVAPQTGQCHGERFRSGAMIPLVCRSGKTGVDAGSSAPNLQAMHQDRRRDRRPVRHVRPATVRHQAAAIAEGTEAVLVGYFSGKQKDFAALMDTAAQQATRHGVRVVGRIVQRRGVPDGGARKMALPYSSRTLLSYGKIREVAALCGQTDADAALFLSTLTERQRRALTGMLGCPAVSLADVMTD
ncbi:hypothetical protein [Streptomyces tauricus]|uniref:hypothetical protein n=1 Tax=Streptomyces tauricus TaxID=68274 RepID=UPI0037FA672A